MMRRSFTLIEVLVVIAVLASMVAVLLPNYMEIRIKARDSKRKSELKNIQKALEVYKNNRDPITYPTGLPPACAQFVDAQNPSIVLMQKFPSEPLYNCTTGYYFSLTDVDTYELQGCLESKSDKDGSLCPNDFLAKTTMTCASNNCYKLTEP